MRLELNKREARSLYALSIARKSAEALLSKFVGYESK